MVEFHFLFLDFGVVVDDLVPALLSLDPELLLPELLLLLLEELDLAFLVLLLLQVLEEDSVLPQNVVWAD